MMIPITTTPKSKRVPDPGSGVATTAHKRSSSFLSNESECIESSPTQPSSAPSCPRPKSVRRNRSEVLSSFQSSLGLGVRFDAIRASSSLKFPRESPVKWKASGVRWIVGEPCTGSESRSPNAGLTRIVSAKTGVVAIRTAARKNKLCLSFKLRLHVSGQ